MRTLRQLKHEERQKDNYLACVQINVASSYFAKKFGIEFEDCYEEGLGVTEVVRLENDLGTRFIIQEYPTTSVITNIFCIFDASNVSETVDEVLETLGLTSKVIVFLHPDIELKPHQLWRQDDHGHKFLIETFVCKADAVFKMRVFERLGHKQIYWVERGAN